MSREIYCQKLKTQAPALNAPPLPGALGEKIYNEISAPAWQQWLEHQTTLINEYRLNMLEPKARQFLSEEMQKYLFTDTAVEKPAGFTARSQDGS